MKYSLSSIGVLLFAMVAVAQAQERVFVDDMGTRHVFTGKPTLAAEASKGALALHSFGVGEDQLLGVRGLWRVRGSSQDIDNPDPNDIFAPVDPTPEELEFLKSRVNLSPMCFQNLDGCWEDVAHMDFDLLKTLKPDYYLYVSGGADFAVPVVEAYMDAGVPTIFIDTWFEYHPDCPVNKTGTFVNCRYKSMLRLTQRLEELALALTGNTDIPAQAQQEKQQACEAAENFQTSMQSAHERGIRTGVVGAYVSDGIRWNLNEPTQYWQTRTFEELGMPVVHTRSFGWSFDEYNVTTWFINCPPGEPSTDCNDQVAIPVDFWIIDTWTYELGTSDDFKQEFPDRALLAGQYWYYARNDGKLTYAAMATILNEMAERIDAAERIYPATDCVEVDITSEQHVDFTEGGLEAGEYACFNSDLFPEDYTTCPGFSETTTATNGGSVNAAASGVAVISSISSLVLACLAPCLVWW